MNDRRGNNDGYDVASRRRLRANPPPPEAGTLWDGVIQRIQPYGAFCSFGPLSGRESMGAQRDQQQRQRRTWQGLIHISQLSETRVEKVEDVVNVDDTVWVKVLEVEKQQAPDHGSTDQHFNARYRVKLSMKDVSQDGTRQDLGREREAKEQVTTQLETNLNSMIGMGVALDPMERLVLKNSGGYGRGNNNSNSSSTKTTFRGGYTLVGDDEGEPEPDPSTTVADNTNRTVRTAPMGRGRGATLPAWMTSAEGPVGTSDEAQKSKTSRKKDAREEKNSHDKYRDHSDADDDDDDSRHRSSRHREKKDRKRHKKKSRHRRRKRRDDYSDSESSDKSDYDERRHRKRHKSSSRRHKRKDHRKDSSKTKDRKRRKLSRHRDDYGKDDDENHRRSESRRYNSDDESSHGNATSDSRSSFSSRGNATSDSRSSFSSR